MIVKFARTLGFVFALLVITVAFVGAGQETTVSSAQFPTQTTARLDARLDGHPTLAPQTFNRTITIDTVDDPTPESARITCTYSGSGGYTAGDSCSFRRALVEAGAVPADQRPVLIAFDLPTDAENTTVPGTWIINIDELNQLPAVTTISRFSDPDSLVTIDGSTQPNGRSDGPSVFINSRWSLTFERQQNVLRNLGFFGGGTIQLEETQSVGGSNLVEGLWMGLTPDGQQIVLQNEEVPRNLAGGGIFALSNNNLIRNNLITGANARAVRIDAHDDNTIVDNIVGTRADGSVPEYQGIGDRCQASTLHNPDFWYGGWGIEVTGSSRNAVVSGNLIAGLQDIRSGNDTPPIALFVAGQDHQVFDNIIGLDGNGRKAGVCGLGIDLGSAGGNIEAFNNVVVYSRFGYGAQREAGDTAILVSSSEGGVAVRGNLVEMEDGLDELQSPTKALHFAPVVPIALRRYEPAQITSIVVNENETLVTGTIGHGTSDNPCIRCQVDFYLDDFDGFQEMLAYWGFIEADDNGNFAVRFDQALPAGHGLRTVSTTTLFNTLPGFPGGTSTKLSSLWVAPDAIELTTPTNIRVNVDEEFIFQVYPEDLFGPVTYRIEAPGAVTPHVEETLSVDTITSDKRVTEFPIRLRWRNAGRSTITITAETALGSISNQFEIVIGDGGSAYQLYLPIIQK
ncbi:MAG: hypothetical protein AAF614_26845 [Chloroflexota bacterium]